MNNDHEQLIRDHPELIRWGMIYFIGFLSISIVGGMRLWHRMKTRTLRFQTPERFPLPFHWGLSFFLVLVAILFWVRGFPALIGLVGGYFFLMHQCQRSWKKVLGLDRFRLSQLICASIGLMAVVIAPTYFVSWVNSMICLVFKIEVTPQPLIHDFLMMDHWKSKVFFIALAVIVAPITEEILFRGILYPVLREAIGMKGAIAISAILFGMAHLHFPMVLPLAFLGVVLALAYEYSGSLFLSIGIHACFNLFTVLNLLLLKPYLIP